MLDAIVEARSVSKTIAILRRAFSGFDGTGFVAKTVTHLLLDCHREAKLFGMRNDDYLSTGVRPNARKVLNLIHRRPLHQNQYCEDEDFFFGALLRMVHAVRVLMPAGAQGWLHRRLVNVCVVQFNVWKRMV